MEAIVKEIIQYPINRSLEEFILFPDREYQPNETEAKQFSKFISIFKYIADDMEAGAKFDSVAVIKDELVKAFTFFFDKGVEIGSAYREDTEPNLDIDFDNIFTGIHGDNIPTELQQKVNGIIPKVIQIGAETIDFAHNKQQEKSLTMNITLRSILTSAAMLGLEYTLRIER
jgi:hypothetical protein